MNGFTVSHMDTTVKIDFPMAQSVDKVRTEGQFVNGNTWVNLGDFFASNSLFSGIYYMHNIADICFGEGIRYSL